MKKLFSILVFLASASAIACPDLSGTYQCPKNSQDPADTGVITLSSIVDNGAFYYVQTDADEPNNPSYLPTDGKEYKDQKGSSYIGTCSESQFTMNTAGVDPQVGPFTVVQNLSKNAQEGLHVEGTLTIQGNNYPFSETCTRL